MVCWCKRYSVVLFSLNYIVPPPHGTADRPRIPRTCSICWSAVTVIHKSLYVCRLWFSPCQKALWDLNFVRKLAALEYIICRHCWCWRRMIEDGMSLSARKARTWPILNTLKYCQHKKIIYLYSKKSYSAINYPCDCPSIYSNIAMYQCVTCIIVKLVTYRINRGLECNVLLV